MLSKSIGMLWIPDRPMGVTAFRWLVRPGRRTSAHSRSRRAGARCGRARANADASIEPTHSRAGAVVAAKQLAKTAVRVAAIRAVPTYYYKCDSRVVTRTGTVETRRRSMPVHDGHRNRNPGAQMVCVYDASVRTHVRVVAVLDRGIH